MKSDFMVPHVIA